MLRNTLNSVEAYIYTKEQHVLALTPMGVDQNLNSQPETPVLV
jgi:hypothetical protein